MTRSKKQFLAAILLMTVAWIMVLIVAQANAQTEPPPKVTINEEVCGQFSAMVTNLPETLSVPVRFQLGHDLVKLVNTSEQDTVAQFKSGSFPAGDWGFSVRIGEQELFNEIVTVKPCKAPVPDRLLEVTEFDCEKVSVLGNGWMPTNATIEVAIPPAEGGESRDDLVVIKQVQPTSEGVFHTTLDWPSPPRDGQYTVIVLIDNIQQDPQAGGFAMSGCGELPFTGPRPRLILLAATLLLTGIVLLILLGRKNRP